MKTKGSWLSACLAILTFIDFGLIAGYGQTGIQNAEAAGGQLTGATAQAFSSRIAVGAYHSLAIRPDGTVSAWGLNDQGRTDVPSGLKDVVAVAAGNFYSLALKADGTVVAWGGNSEGQTDVPKDLKDVVAIAAGRSHALALKGDGTVVGWGKNSAGQANVPADLKDVVAIAAGDEHSLALKSDGTVVAWGSNNLGQTGVPSNLNNVVAISANFYHSMALKKDGAIVVWGDDREGLGTVPPGLTDVVAIAAGNLYSLALKGDGTVVAWGDNGSSQTDVPAGLNNVKGIVAGDDFSLVMKEDGTLVSWGRNNSYSELSVPESVLSSLSVSAKGKDIGLNPVFDKYEQEYTSEYVGKSINEVDIGLGIERPDDVTVTVNGDPHTPGQPITVPVHGSQTPIKIKVDSYFQPERTYTIHVKRDIIVPVVTIGTNGNDTLAQFASTKVNASDSETSLKTLAYTWSKTSAIPTDGWQRFRDGDTLTKSSGDGDWYLHVRAVDQSGNIADVVSKRFRLDNTAPVIHLNGNNPMSVKEGKAYKEPGATVTDNSGEDVSGNVTITGHVDKDTLGDYEVTYKVEDTAGNVAAVIRKVRVVSPNTPTLKLTGDRVQTLTVGDTFKDPGASANDKQDGDLTQQIETFGNVNTSQPGIYTVTYAVTDSDNNLNVITRVVKVEAASTDTTGPSKQDPASEPTSSKDGNNGTSPPKNGSNGTTPGSGQSGTALVSGEKRTSANLISANNATGPNGSLQPSDNNLKSNSGNNHLPKNGHHSNNGGILPKTAAGLYYWLFAGLVIILLGLVTLRYRRRKQS